MAGSKWRLGFGAWWRGRGGCRPHGRSRGDVRPGRIGTTGATAVAQLVRDHRSHRPGDVAGRNRLRCHPEHSEPGLRVQLRTAPRQPRPRWGRAPGVGADLAALRRRPHGHRHRGADAFADPRGSRRRRHRLRPRLGLRAVDPDPSQRRHGDHVRPQRRQLRQGRTAGVGGPADRSGRKPRPVDGSAPALRGGLPGWIKIDPIPWLAARGVIMF